MKKPQVSLDGVSRLRKLKQKEKKEVVNAVEFERRLKDQYKTITEGGTAGNGLFNWAKNTEEKGGQTNEDEFDDPIARLLKTNTRVFSKQSTIFKSGKLHF